ncbi:MAG: thioesterase family protein [Candidatus Marinimicrobia bacterium]|nr:thioesterase family protein [Candidatus Neomarinimicrobiota bacterium]
MYPYLLTLRTVLTARFRPTLQFDGISQITLRAGINDIDMYGEINNGRQLTLMDLGRYDLGVRVGLMEVVRKKNWGLAVGGISIRYRRRIPFLRRYTLKSRVLSHDERWFYFLQEMWCQDNICSSALVKAGVVSKSGLIPAKEVLKEFPDLDWNEPLPDWVNAWIQAESKRPWPSNSD